MIYVKAELPYGRKYSEKEQRFLQQVCLSTCTFDAQGEMDASRCLIMPWTAAKLMVDHYRGINVVEIFTEEEIKSMVNLFESKIILNERTGVAVPSDAVMRVNDVKILEDCCTDVLKGELDAGWQILAVCPQPQRRPDYVMGRVPQKPAAKPSETAHDDNVPF